MSDDTDFMAEAESARHTRPSMASNLLLYTVAALVVLFFLWAGYSTIEEIARGSGQVVPSREVQVVQSLEGGILAGLLVAEGDLVTKGDVLLRISDIQFSSEERGTEARFAGLRARKIRLEAEAGGTALVMPADITESTPQIAANEIALHQSRQQELANAISILEDKIQQASAQLAETKAQISRLYNNKTLLQEELEITTEMVRQRAVPKLEEIRLRRELSDIEGQIRAQGERRSGLEAELRAARKEKEDQHDKFRSQALGDLNEVETEIASLRENLRSIEDRVYRTELRAPVNGIINNVAIKTIGGVVEPAQRLVEIVPMDDDLKISAKVSPNDIGFLEVGQAAKVKITSYDPQRYGGLDGKLTRIGANSVSDRDGNIFFEVEVRTDRNYLGTADRPLPITPGMPAQVEIITGKRSILSYLAKPFLQARDRALRER